jgi:hypothetical protein
LPRHLFLSPPVILSEKTTSWKFFFYRESRIDIRIPAVLF